MNRSDIVKAIANQCPMTQKQVDEVLEILVETIKLSLECDEPVMISGFGKFSIRYRKPVIKFNPKTKERVEVPAKKTFIFSPSRLFKASLTKTMEASLEEETQETLEEGIE